MVSPCRMGLHWGTKRVWEAGGTAGKAGACWGLVSRQRRTGLGKVICSCPITESTGTGSEGSAVYTCTTWGASASGMLCCSNSKAQGCLFSAVPWSCVAVALLC